MCLTQRLGPVNAPPSPTRPSTARELIYLRLREASRQNNLIGEATRPQLIDTRATQPQVYTREFAVLFEQLHRITRFEQLTSSESRGKHGIEVHVCSPQRLGRAHLGLCNGGQAEDCRITGIFLLVLLVWHICRFLLLGLIVQRFCFKRFVK